jgi:O-antigen ligase
MIFYYAFLLLTPFQDHPKLGAELLSLGFTPVTPIKIAGLMIVVVAFFAARPDDAALRQSTAMPLLYAGFALFPVLTTIVAQRGSAGASISALLSFAMLLIATRSLVCTRERLVTSLRVLLFSEAIGSLWLYKQYYIEHWLQPNGPSSDGNYEALALVMLLPIAVHMFRFDESRFWRLFALWSIPVMGYGVLVAQSRGGLLAMVLIGLVGWFHSRRKGVTMLLFVAVAGAMLAFGPQAMWDRVRQVKVSGQAETGAEVSTRTRIELWRGGLRMIEQNPIFGVGLENFKPLVGKYNPALYSVIDQNYIAHNTYIHLAAEGGLPTLILFLATLLSSTSKFRAAQRETAPGGARLSDLALSMRIGMYAYFAAAFFISAQFQKEMWVFVFIAPNLHEIAAAETARWKEVKPAAVTEKPIVLNDRIPRAIPRLAVSRSA